MTITAICLLLTRPANATTTPAPGSAGAPADGGVVWCIGDGSAYPAIPGYPADTAPDGLLANPADTPDGWTDNPILTNGDLGQTAETGVPAAPTDPDDRYAIQLNYWNSVNSTPGGSIGYSKGNSCMVFYYNTSYANVGQFTITYPANPSQPTPVTNDPVNEQTWAAAHPNSFPWFGNAPYSLSNTDGGPTGYVSTFKGCSWDNNSCTPGSAVLTAANPLPTSTNWNSFPQQLSAITSIPTTWSIEFNNKYGNPKDGTQTWDASYDIWFDKTGQNGTGQAPYGPVRGQNDGLEIMVWMNSGHSYVDTPGGPTPNVTGYAQPSGWPRGQVVINGVLYDVWSSRLNNPYFGYLANTGDVVIGPGEEPYSCTTLPVNGGSTTCGTEWNVVSFVATKDSNNTDYRQTSMSMDTKVFTDYILGIKDSLYTIQNETAGNRTSSGVLACPTSAMDSQQANPPVNPSACLSQSWFLTSVQAGFEPWIGGNGLQSDTFQAHVLTTSTAVQSGLTSSNGTPVVNWQDPFQVVYSGCSTYSTANTASFLISGVNSQTGLPETFPTNGQYQSMGEQLPGTDLFEYTVNAPGTPQLYPIHGNATISFESNCGTTTTITIYIDPSGHIYYSDGKTPVVGANVTLDYSPSGSGSGPFVAVPNHNFGLASAVMQPNDNTLNPMPSTQYGAYAWNVAPGYYEVNASLNGCGSTTSAVQHVTTTPVMGLNLNLPCAPPPPLPPPTGSASCHVSYSVTSAVAGVSNGLTANINIQNNGKTAIYPWTLGWTFPGNQKISYAWNVNTTQNGEKVSLSSTSPWESIPAGATLTGAVGFNGSFTGTNTNPTAFTLNGVPCD
jgi:hypothetical protein